jgi:hypothetical protein
LKAYVGGEGKLKLDTFLCVNDKDKWPISAVMDSCWVEGLRIQEKEDPLVIYAKSMKYEMNAKVHAKTSVVWLLKEELHLYIQFA